MADGIKFDRPLIIPDSSVIGPVESAEEEHQPQNPAALRSNVIVDDDDDNPHRLVDDNDNFADDAIAAHTKNSESARDRNRLGRKDIESKDRLEIAQRRVREAKQGHNSSEKDSLDAGERRRTEGLTQSTTRGGLAAETLVQQELQIKGAMEELQALLLQVDLAGGLEALEAVARRSVRGDGKIRDYVGAEPGRLAGNMAKLLELNAKLIEAEARIKGQLQHLLVGGVGFALLSDPRLSFRRLLERINTWPKRVRPGRHPITDEDFDDFIAWVFEPPAPVELLEDIQF